MAYLYIKEFESVEDGGRYGAFLSAGVIVFDWATLEPDGSVKLEQEDYEHYERYRQTGRINPEYAAEFMADYEKLRGCA